MPKLSLYSLETYLQAARLQHLAKLKEARLVRGRRAGVSVYYHADGERLGRHRGGLERMHARLAAFGKLRVRFERCLDTHLVLLTLACAVICARFAEMFC